MRVKPKFDKKSQTDFYQVLRTRVHAYFDSNQISPYANSAFYVKVGTGFLLWLLTYVLILLSKPSPEIAFVLIMLHVLLGLFLAFNLAHDANHHAVSASARVNRIFSYMFDLLGVNSYLWRLEHSTHHTFANVPEVDNSIADYAIIRFSWHAQRKPWHQFQALYVPLLYGFSTLNFIFVRDYVFFFTNYKYSPLLGKKTPVDEAIKMVIWKMLFYFFAFVLPLYFLPIPLWQGILMYFFAYFLQGMIMGFVFQCGHLLPETHYPLSNEDGKVREDWASCILRTSFEYGRKQKWLQWLSGGLNIHASHHLFPRVCHVHYPQLAEIIAETAKEFDLPYQRVENLQQAVGAHLKFLWILGHQDKSSNSLEGVLT